MACLVGLFFTFFACRHSFFTITFDFQSMEDDVDFIHCISFAKARNSFIASLVLHVGLVTIYWSYHITYALFGS